MRYRRNSRKGNLLNRETQIWVKFLVDHLGVIAAHMNTPQPFDLTAYEEEQVEEINNILAEALSNHETESIKCESQHQEKRDLLKDVEESSPEEKDKEGEPC